jgi:hypothetical protein
MPFQGRSQSEHRFRAPRRGNDAAVRFRFLGILSVLSMGVVSVACGGSSSETPPPLEPLPVNLHYDRASTALSGEVLMTEADAGAIVRAEEAPPENEAPPARSTWGTDRGGSQTPLK